MSESNKPSSNEKPQPPSQNKPETKPTPPPGRDYSMGRTIIGDSADNITRKNKP